MFSWSWKLDIQSKIVFALVKMRFLRMWEDESFAAATSPCFTPNGDCLELLLLPVINYRHLRGKIQTQVSSRIIWSTIIPAWNQGGRFHSSGMHPWNCTIRIARVFLEHKYLEVEKVLIFSFTLQLWTQEVNFWFDLSDPRRISSHRDLE